jgi:hypothetical protein
MIEFNFLLDLAANTIEIILFVWGLLNIKKISIAISKLWIT